MKKNVNRMDRISDLVQSALAEIIHREIDDPRVGMITIEEVKIAKDLSQARVYVSVLNTEKAKETIATLNKASGFLRTQLGHKVKLRVTPHLVFFYDDTTLKAESMSRLIDSALKKDRKNSDENPQEE